MDFQNQVVLVTGGSRGIGKAISLAFAQKGAQVVVNFGHEEDAARQVEKEIEQAGGKAQVRRADITRLEDVDRMFKETLDQFGRLDVLVNNAGIIRDTHLMLMSEKDWDIVIETNLKGTFYCCRAALRPMIGQKAGESHQYGFPQRNHRKGRADQLCGFQRRRDQPHQIPGPGSGFSGHSGERGLSGNHPDGIDGEA